MIVGMNEKLESMMLGYQNKDDSVAFGDVMNCVVDSVAAGDTGRQDTERQQYRKIERADDERHAVGHFVDLRANARKALDSAEMCFRLCPFSESLHGFRDLGQHDADIAEIRFCGTAAEIITECGGKQRLVCNDCIFEAFELPQPEFYGQCLSGSEEPALCLDNLVNGILRPHKISLRSK